MIKGKPSQEKLPAHAVFVLFFCCFFFNILFPWDRNPMLNTLPALLERLHQIKIHKGSTDLTKIQWECQKTMQVNNQKDAHDWRKDLRICPSMIISRRLFVVHYSLPPLLVRPHFNPLDVPPIEAFYCYHEWQDHAFSADCCPFQHRLRSFLLTESGHFFLFLLLLLSTSCIFSPFILPSSLVPSLFLSITWSMESDCSIDLLQYSNTSPEDDS